MEVSPLSCFSLPIPAKGGSAGGRAVYVSATGDRTCVVTDCGDLFTWGSSGDPGVLGLGPGKYQPTPKRVVGIKRAVRVALGSDHTLVLLAASVPPLPYALEPASGGEGGAVVSQHDNEPEKEKRESGGESPLKLKELAERRIAQCVTLRDVVSALSFADFYDAKELSRFCVDFILRFESFSASGVFLIAVADCLQKPGRSVHAAAELGWASSPKQYFRRSGAAGR